MQVKLVKLYFSINPREVFTVGIFGASGRGCIILVGYLYMRIPVLANGD